MASHRTKVQADRSRVICLDCPWFLHDAALSEDQLRQRGYGHKHAAVER